MTKHKTSERPTNLKKSRMKRNEFDNDTRKAQFVKHKPNKDTVQATTSTKPVQKMTFKKTDNSKKPLHRSYNPKPAAKKDIKITKVLALDCEMVGDEYGRDMLARVSIVNYSLECVYDKFVKPQFQVKDFRTKVSGVRPKDIENGEDFSKVRDEVKQLIRNKILVGHALGNDFKVLRLNHPRVLIRDTSFYKPFRDSNDGRSPPLKKLAQKFLNVDIQQGEHNSIEDSKIAMMLYKICNKEWEMSLVRFKPGKSEHKKVNHSNSSMNVMPSEFVSY